MASDDDRHPCVFTITYAYYYDQLADDMVKLLG